MTTPTRAARLIYSTRALLCALAALALLAPALALAAPIGGTFVGKIIGREVAFKHNGKDRNDWAGVLKFKLDNGADVPVFCIQLDVRVSPGDPYRGDGSMLDLPNGCQIRYLLDRYPASNVKDADEAAARQLAIWVYSDNLDLSTVTDAKVRDRAIALANEAKGKPCPPRRTEAPDLKIEPPVANAPAGQPIAYTLRAGPADAGQTATLIVDGPAVLSDANGTNSGQQQQQVALDGQGAATFWVLGTGAGQTTISAQLPYVLGVGTVFSQLDDSKPSQRLVLAQNQRLIANAVARASWAAGAPPPTATPEQAPPTPTRRPHKDSPTEQPTEQVPEQPTATQVAAEAATATPEQAPQAATATPEVAAAPADTAAGGAAPTRPRSLPRTGDAASPPFGLFALVALALALGGLMLRRRAAR